MPGPSQKHEVSTKTLGTRLITDEIARRLKDAEIFAVMTDDTPDASHKEQLSVIVRYVYQAEIEERLLALRIVDDTTSETLFETLCDVLQSNEIDASKIRTQCYDGAPMFLAYEQVSKQE
jgi:ATP phosphoribosyltransferase regulatory subunit HisZ